jgi:predicted amidohydrolase
MTHTSYIAACVQTNSQNNLTENIEKTNYWIEQAALQKATFVTLPENVAFMGKNKEELFDHSFIESQHPALKSFKAQAKKLNIWLMIGSLAIKLPALNKIANRSYLIRPDGTIHARYTKIHLYDAAVKQGESHQESALCEAGKISTLASTECGKIGMTICYDVRFPHLYRRLAQKGAEIVTVPAAFTYYTGQAHWHVLLRARAIETASYIIAPAQTGSHPSGRRTFGHSLIINPWGEVLADAGDAEGIITAPIELATVQEIREQLPSLHLERSFSVTKKHF